jgi:Carboxypeptidase regulatory-like domain/TonB dependent receptor-like, beta-barrel
MFRKLVLSSCWILLLAMGIHAQYTSVIKGHVTDPSGAAVPGATLTLTGSSLQGQKTAVSDAEGNFVFLGLAPGDYELEIKQTGFQSLKQPDVNLRAGQTLVLELSLTVGNVAQTVDVAARGGGEKIPIIDTVNPEQNYNVSGEFLNKLPMSTRQNWESVWFLVPGAVTIGRNGPDGVNFDPQINGASERSNSYKLNGFEIGNSFTNQGWTTQFSTEAIQDVQIKTFGADASTPLGEGGFINVTTKSGGNQFHGSAALFWQPRNFNWNNIPGGTPLDQDLTQPEGTIGGPIIKDRFWFFASYRWARINQGVPRTAAALQAFADNGFERPDYDLEERNNRFLGKLTYRLNDKHILTLNYLNDDGVTNNSDSRDNSTQEAAIKINSGGPLYQGTWTYTITPRLLLNVNYGYRRIIGDVVPNGGDNPSITRYGATALTGGVLTGSGAALIFYSNRSGGFFADTSIRDHHEATADLSWYKSEWLGSHTFQAGFQWKPNTRSKGDVWYTSNGLILIDEVRRTVNGQVVVTPFHKSYITPTRYPRIVGSTRLFGGYVQDRWTPTRRLTLSLGVRVDNQSGQDAFDVKRLDTVSIGPRLGLSYSLTKNGRDVVRLTWGRVHDIVYNQAAPSIGSRTGDRRDEYDNDLDGVFETVRTTPGIGINSPPVVLDRLVDPNLHAGFTDDFRIGYTRQLPHQFVLDAAYVNRKFQDRAGTVDTNIIYEGGLFRGYRNPAVNAILTSTNLTNFHRRFHGVEFSLIRNIGAKLQTFTSYSYQKLTEIGEFRYDEVNRYLAPAEWYKNDKLARPHIFRVNASYYLPWRFTVATIFSLESGVYGGPLIKTLAANDPEVAAHGPQQLTLSNGRVVSNPLYATTRLVGPRGEGQLRAPNLPRLNMRFGKEFRFKENHTLEANADFFNITNNGAPMFFSNGTNTTLATFGRFQSTTQSPRGAQLSVRWRF